MSTSTKPLTAAQRNHRQVMKADLFHEVADDGTVDSDYPMLRTLGKAVIDMRHEVDAIGAHQQSLRPLLRRIDALCDAADAAYQWHVGNPIPQEG